MTLKAEVRQSFNFNQGKLEFVTTSFKVVAYIINTLYHHNSVKVVCNCFGLMSWWNLIVPSQIIRCKFNCQCFFTFTSETCGLISVICYSRSIKKWCCIWWWSDKSSKSQNTMSKYKLLGRKVILSRSGIQVNGWSHPLDEFFSVKKPDVR